MSRWDKHRTTGQPDELVGEEVGSMTIIGQDGDDSLQLRCPNGHEFWFDDRSGGRNAVEKTSPEGTTEFHARCPTCQATWNGDITHYYAIGFLLKPPSPQAVAFLAMVMGRSPSSGSVETTVGIFDAVKAGDPFEAVQKAKVPKNVPAQAREYGIAVRQISQDDYRSIKSDIGMRNLHKRAEQTGDDFGDLLSSLFGDQTPSRFGGGETDDANDAAKVMESMQGKK